VTAGLVHAVDGRAFGGTEAVWRMVGWYAWVPTTMLVLEAARRFPVDRSHWLRSLPLHLVGAVAASLFASVLATMLHGLVALGAGRPFGLVAATREAFSRDLAFGATLYFTIVAVAHALDYYRRYQEREVQASELKAALMAAQLKALKMQLHPHFFFNALHTISMLVRQHQEREAIEVIAGLGDLFRYVLDHAETQVVLLEQELDFLQSYLAIEQVRFKDRLTVEMDIDPRALSAQVPALLLQPLVENALRHGIEPGVRPGHLRVRARREGTRLRLQVQDNGRGLPPGWRLEAQQGVGLANTRARLERIYGATYHLSFEPAPEGGLTATITIPHRLEHRLPAGDPAPLPVLLC